MLELYESATDLAELTFSFIRLLPAFCKVWDSQCADSAVKYMNVIYPIWCNLFASSTAKNLPLNAFRGRLRSSSIAAGTQISQSVLYTSHQFLIHQLRLRLQWRNCRRFIEKAVIYYRLGSWADSSRQGIALEQETVDCRKMSWPTTQKENQQALHNQCALYPALAWSRRISYIFSHLILMNRTTGCNHALLCSLRFLFINMIAAFP